MIKDSEKGLFDTVIVWKLDRFARNRYDSAHYKAVLRKHGAKVISATEVISEGAEGIILESVLEGYAEYYSAELSEKVIRGMTENALKCQYNGGPGTIGYIIDENKHYVIDSLVAPFVKESFRMYADGYFEFGGSTIILLFEKNKIIPAPEILINSALGEETSVGIMLLEKNRNEMFLYKYKSAHIAIYITKFPQKLDF